MPDALELVERVNEVGGPLASTNLGARSRSCSSTKAAATTELIERALTPAIRPVAGVSSSRPLPGLNDHLPHRCAPPRFEFSFAAQAVGGWFVGRQRPV